MVRRCTSCGHHCQLALEVREKMFARLRLLDILPRAGQCCGFCMRADSVDANASSP